MCIAVYILAFIIFCLPVNANASMTLNQMKLLKGAAQLDITVDQLFRSCGLPAIIVDYVSVDVVRQSLDWRGVNMHLSAMDWDVVYGVGQSKQNNTKGWSNSRKSKSRCISETSQLLFHTKGHVGVLTVTKKAQGLGYITTYREPTSLYKAHKVISAKVTLKRSIPALTLVNRYGQQDDVVKQSRTQVVFRYWVVTLRDNRPESLYAVDFEVKDGICNSYVISTSAVDFVQQRLDALLINWERDYVLD